MPHTPNTQLGLLLRAAEWSPAQLARAVRLLAHEHGLDAPCHHTTVRRWLDGTQPRPPFPELVLESLSRRLGRPVGARDAGLTRAPAVLVDPSWEADPVRKLDRLTHAELDPQRRALLGAGVFTLTALALPDLPAPTDPAAHTGGAQGDRTRWEGDRADRMPLPEGRVGRMCVEGGPVGQMRLEGCPVGRMCVEGSPVGQMRSEGSPVSRMRSGESQISRLRADVSQVDRMRSGEAQVAQMRSMASVFAAAADQYGGRHVRAALGAYLAHDVLPRLHAPAGDRVRSELLSAAAQLTLLLGGMCADGGHDAAAQHYHQTAARLAADAADHLTLAVALRTMATHAHDLGHRTPAVLHLTEQADRHARHSPPGVRAYVRIHLAVLQAPHDRTTALATLTRAERLHARAETVPGPFGTYPAGALHYQCAQALTALGDHAGAIKALTSSLRLRGPGERLPAALTGARLAETHLRLGHLEQALHHWRIFLDAYPTVHSARATRRLHAARRHLRPHQRHRGTAELLDRIHTLTGTPA